MDEYQRNEEHNFRASSAEAGTNYELQTNITRERVILTTVQGKQKGAPTCCRRQGAGHLKQMRQSDERTRQVKHSAISFLGERSEIASPLAGGLDKALCVSTFFENTMLAVCRILPFRC